MDIQVNQPINQTQSPPNGRLNSHALPDELTHPCPYCGEPIKPYEVDRPWGEKSYHWVEWCECEAAIKAQDELRIKERDEVLKEKLSQLLHGAGIGVGRYARMKFDTWDAARHVTSEKHLNDVKSYCDEVKITGANLCFIYGQYGRGKTHLAIAAIRYITKLHLEDEYKCWSPYFVEWLTQCSKVQESWSSDDGDTEVRLWNRMRNATILVIDDIDKGRPSEWAMSKLLEIVQHRYVRELPTIITANHSLHQLQEVWSKSDKSYVRDAGGAITSRFMEQLWGQIEVTGPDQRDN